MEGARNHIIACYNERCWIAEEYSEAARIHSELLDEPGDLAPVNGNGKGKGKGKAKVAEAAHKDPVSPEKGDAQ